VSGRGSLNAHRPAANRHGKMIAKVRAACSMPNPQPDVAIGLMPPKAPQSPGYLWLFDAGIASATHAWVEILIPGVGWRGLDPTHNRQPDESYVKIAVGRDYAEVPPVTGAYKGTTDRKMEVSVKIKPDLS
jgi:transglutaminase-like putative cysteine protease